jgi:hypothetical protein
MLETVNFPLVYPLDSNFDKLDRVRAIKQRIQERQKKLQIINGNHEDICQIANDILVEPNTEQANKQLINKLNLTQKLETIKQRLQNRQDKLLVVECENEKVLKIADNALMQADREIQNVQRIEQEQKDIRQQMLIVRHDLKVAHGNAARLKQEQIDISKNLELMQKILSEALFNVNLLFPRLDKVFLGIAQVKFNHKDIDKGFKGVYEQSQLIQIDQARLSIKLRALNQPDTSLSSDLIDWINAKVFQDPIVKEKVQEFLDEYPFFQLAADIATDPSGEKFNEAWEKIKNSTKSVSSYLWTNLTSIASKTVSWIAWAALEAYRLKDKIIPTLIQWGWAYVASNVSPITWIALGVFASCFAKSLIANYPLISMAVFGYLFLVYMNYDYIKPMIWPTNG